MSADPYIEESFPGGGAKSELDSKIDHAIFESCKNFGILDLSSNPHGLYFPAEQKCLFLLGTFPKGCTAYLTSENKLKNSIKQKIAKKINWSEHKKHFPENPWKIYTLGYENSYDDLDIKTSVEVYTLEIKCPEKYAQEQKWHFISNGKSKNYIDQFALAFIVTTLAVMKTTIQMTDEYFKDRPEEFENVCSIFVENILKQANIAEKTEEEVKILICVTIFQCSFQFFLTNEQIKFQQQIGEQFDLICSQLSGAQGIQGFMKYFGLRPIKKTTK